MICAFVDRPVTFRRAFPRSPYHLFLLLSSCFWVVADIVVIADIAVVADIVVVVVFAGGLLRN